MNIFEIFTYGNGRMDEPNLTSILAFLLDPQESHGFGTSFINEFLLPIESQVKKICDQQKFKFEEISLQLKDSPIIYQVRTEERFRSINTNERIIDIVITLKDHNGNDSLIIGIENKIRKESASDVNQLTDELKHLLNSKDEDVPLIFIYITPFSVTETNKDSLWENLLLYSNSLLNANLAIANYSWGYLTDLSDTKPSSSIKKITYQLLEKERNAEINPASSHSELLLRSLIRHIDTKISPSSKFKISDIDNLMETNLDSEYFWNKDWGNKNSSMIYAKKYKEYINIIINDFLLTKVLEKDYSKLYLINRSSRVRYIGYLSLSSFTDLDKRITKGRIYRIRADGGTNTKKIEILFTYYEDLLEQYPINKIPLGVTASQKDGEICINFQIEDFISEEIKIFVKILLTQYSIPSALIDLKEL